MRYSGVSTCVLVGAFNGGPLADSETPSPAGPCPCSRPRCRHADMSIGSSATSPGEGIAARLLASPSWVPVPSPSPSPPNLPRFVTGASADPPLPPLPPAAPPCSEQGIRPPSSSYCIHGKDTVGRLPHVHAGKAGVRRSGTDRGAWRRPRGRARRSLAASSASICAASASSAVEKRWRRGAAVPIDGLLALAA